jgi:plastocyanin
MDRQVRIAAWIGALMVVLAMTLSTDRHAFASNSPRVVEITAKRFGFTPEQVTLKKGETVTLRLQVKTSHTASSCAS